MNLGNARKLQVKYGFQVVQRDLCCKIEVKHMAK